jgi:glycine/D-amino acid oxidase-like deaminating enzyme
MRVVGGGYASIGTAFELSRPEHSDNLNAACDWTLFGLDSGRVESAATSGRLAAHMISSSPALEDIVDYDHP